MGNKFHEPGEVGFVPLVEIELGAPITRPVRRAACPRTDKSPGGGRQSVAGDVERTRHFPVSAESAVLGRVQDTYPPRDLTITATSTS